MTFGSTDRFAFLVGNSDYGLIGRLPNAERDVGQIAKKLESLGFRVQSCTNLTEQEFRSAFAEFLGQLDKTRTVDSVVFYFAGHGFQESGFNYLLPIPDEEGLASGLSLARILSDLEEKAPRRIVFMDACRTDFDKRSAIETLEKTRAAAGEITIDNGLAEFAYGPETYLAFSAAPGKPAYDGDAADGMSPFARALVECLDRVERPISTVMQEVRARVRSAVRGEEGPKQDPWDSNNLTRPYFFRPFPLLFLVVNVVPLCALFVALGVLLLAGWADMSRAISGDGSGFVLTGVAVALFLIAAGVLIHGFMRTVTWQRGDGSETGTRPSLWPSGLQCALGGMSSGIAGMPIVVVPYWLGWRSVEWLDECREHSFFEAILPTDCPPLAKMLVEGAFANMYIQGGLAFFAIYFAVNATEGKISAIKGSTPRRRFVAGATIGGVLAGLVVGIPVCMYFASQPRPFFDPGFSMAFSVACVVILAYSVINYSLLQFSPVRLLRSLLGAVVSAIIVLSSLGLIIFILGQLHVVDLVFDWAFDGFWDESKPIAVNFLYLIVAGTLYGSVFGLFLGLLIGLAFIFTGIDLRTAEIRVAQQAIELNLSQLAKWKEKTDVGN